MSVNPTLVQQMLEQDTHAATELLKLLNQESEILKQRDHEALQTLVTQKSEHISLLEAHAAERNALLKSLDLPANNNGWLAFLQSDPQLASLKPGYDSLNDTLSQCRERNEINGKLIGRSQQTLRKLLDLVKGQSPNADLYTATGTTSKSGLSNTVTKA
ncbi:flagella synthesis protein FlgN [Gilvimarinus xylanilyticus]|uniref:Flagellar protein FlgN n=1 Tax=Gilvimarinus xylanilyticus TaxID=2944139 RepID=A0A9X2HUV8_9GAMM|nr:flagellar protein FlgN [Gilvimarinus xylanilyticus]MCP8898645.1 flagellar protein FlgN [Gilvimarinus xylanilyticus]